MFTFREWIQFCEQPHIYAPSPISFKLDGVPYRNITLIDPRIGDKKKLIELSL